jgi:hypothetical protein
MATIEQRIYDGNRAAEVLNNEAFQKAFADIEEQFVQAWKDSPARDVEGREKIWTCLGLLKKLKGSLEGSLETGKLAELDMLHKRNALERMKDSFGL